LFAIFLAFGKSSLSCLFIKLYDISQSSVYDNLIWFCAFANSLQKGRFGQLDYSIGSAALVWVGATFFRRADKIVAFSIDH
jgi:hypothetical protein